MVQMKTMKWRNAYILIYERKSPIDVVDTDEEAEKSSSFKKEDVDMRNVHTSQELCIQSEIEEKIAYENQKYWQNRFLFANEFHEFVQDIALYWNTSCIIPNAFLTKNDDSAITGFPIPDEYLNEKLFPEPLDQKLSIPDELIPENEERVFKLAAGVYITII